MLRARIPDEMPALPVHTPLLAWYAGAARDLPWRRPGTAWSTPWAVLVSEGMLQQTPVARVEPVFLAWLERWPTPGDLAAEPAGEAVRAWGRLGYPRRALRLHQAAVQIVERHDGQVPSSYDELRGLPGVGDYTAAAVLAFAFGRRCAVLDTNVRRVLARLFVGVALPPAAVIARERRWAEDLQPDEPALAARWAIGLMELGALVCTARAPRCGECPVSSHCRWKADGCPAYDGPPRRTQGYEGTDRQARGRLLALLRASDRPAPHGVLLAVCPDEVQARRALASLLADGLVVQAATGYRLP